MIPPSYTVWASMTSSKDYVHSTFPLAFNFLALACESPSLSSSPTVALPSFAYHLLAPAAAPPIHQAKKVHCRIARSTVDSTIYIIQNKLIDKNG